MNLNTKNYDDFIEKVKQNNNERFLCKYIENKNSFVYCSRTGSCHHLKAMIEGFYYDCDMYI